MNEPFDGSFSGFSGDAPTATLVPDRVTRSQRRPNRQPRYHVILWDSDDHTFDYVEGMSVSYTHLTLPTILLV